MTKREMINTSKILYWSIMINAERKFSNDIERMNNVKRLAIQFDRELDTCMESNEIQRVYGNMKNLYGSVK